MTTWRPVPGWEGFYEVSEDGQVKSLKRRVRSARGDRRVDERIITPRANRHGYLMVTLCREGRQILRAVHRVVGDAFLGVKPDGLQTCHNDGDRLNNHYTNLRYGTASENARDRRRHGTDYLAAKTHCIRGHEFTPETTYINKNTGWRQCRPCMTIRAHARYEASKGKAA